MTDLENALAAKLLALADDELGLAHRDSEWTGHAPILEEDIAMANIAQDELGHATLWLGILTELKGEGLRYADSLAFSRDARDFRNVQMVEWPKGDWAFTMLRQYLFDAYEIAWLSRATASADARVAAAATKILREEIYHLRHTATWVKRLGIGTPESQLRMQAALDTLWPMAQQLFVPMPDEASLVEANIVPDLSEVRAAWRDVVRPWLAASQLTVDDDAATPQLSREQHSPHLEALLADMQSVARADPLAEW